ncbi:MAG TPA: hypothetical protein VGR07_13245 [Thermoanaerobaculia bacterium]|jgi:hypothetical protein|nr:hypothetical protein [Thermoanaerobaculia bacterium]
MALSEDQRALLHLLLGGDTYEQVAELLGESPGEVRARAQAAAQALEGAPERDLSPEGVRERLGALDDPQGGAAQQTPAAGPPGTTGGRRWLLWLVGGAAALVLLVVLLVTGSGGNGGGTTTTTGGTQEDVVPIQLSPVGGSRASGMISVVRVADQPAVDLAIQGLAPSGRGESYVLWFVGSGGRSLPVAFHAVGSDGKLTGRTAIATAAEGLLPSFDSAELTLTHQREAAAAVRQAAQSGTLPQVIGTAVLRGSLR